LDKQGRVLQEDMPGEGFGTSFHGGRHHLFKSLHPNERFLGLGEALGPIDKRGMGITMNNTDTYKYGDPRLPMYTNVPFYIGVRDSLLYGFFYHNSTQAYFNLGQSTPDYMSITGESGSADYFFIGGKDMASILEGYTYLTGRMPLPPKWALGFHQSRCSYFPQQQVSWVGNTFRTKQIPLDGIVLDADYLHQYQPFRIDSSRFPNMRGLSDELKQQRIELIASVNPGIAVDSSYAAYRNALQADVLLKYPTGKPVRAAIWPNMNHYVDFTSSRGRSWWSKQMKFLADAGIQGYWNDMNEPAVGGSYLPANIQFDMDGTNQYTLSAKNLYGMLMARGSYEAAKLHVPKRRPFVLTRSGFAGVQRYAAVWTGDNTATSEYLLKDWWLNHQMGLSGIPFVGDDIGGYIGPTSKDLYIRWMQSGAFAPFMRSHKEAFAAANEPWAFGEEAEIITRSYIELRYRLAPYWYSLFREASKTGVPMVRPLSYYHPHEANSYAAPFSYQSWIGSQLMLVPVTPEQRQVEVWLPEGNWYDVHTDQRFTGGKAHRFETVLHHIPLLAKSGAIIPMQRLNQSMQDANGDTLYVHVYTGANGEQLFYDDAGDGWNYDQGDFHQRLIRYDESNRRIIFDAATGIYRPSYRYIAIVWHGQAAATRSFRYQQQSLSSLTVEQKWVDPLTGLAQLYFDVAYVNQLRASEQMLPQRMCVIPFTNQSIEITW
jgi:alpha-glucosidase